MINQICGSLSQLMQENFIQGLTMKFHGKNVSAFAQGIRGDRRWQITKMIGIIAVAAMAIIIIIWGAARCYLSDSERKIDHKPNENDDKLPVFASPLVEKIPVQRNPQDIKEEPHDNVPIPQGNKEQDNDPIPLDNKEEDKPIPAQPDKAAKIENSQGLLLPEEARSRQFREDLEISYSYITPIKERLLTLIPVDPNLEMEIKNLGFFEENFDSYEIIANRLFDLFDLHFNTFLNQGPKKDVQDPFTMMFIDAYMHLSFVFGKLAERCFNAGDFTKCVELAQKIKFNDDLKNPFFIAIGGRLIQSNHLEEAWEVLKKGSYCKERDNLLLGIATAYLKQTNLEQALKKAKDLLYSSERNNLILSIAQGYFDQNDKKQALNILNGMPYSKERDDFIYKTAQFYLDHNDLEDALNIVKDRLYSKEKDAFLLKIAQGYFDQNDKKQALTILNDMPYSKERDDFIYKTAQFYVDHNDLEDALNIVKDRLYSKERDAIFFNIAQGYFDQNDKKQALNILNDMPYSKEREDFIYKIAQFYVDHNDLEDALKIVKDRSYSKERDAIFFNIAQAYFDQNKRGQALKIAADHLPYSKEKDDFLAKFI